jgi:hypothetical protein
LEYVFKETKYKNLGEEREKGDTSVLNSHIPV